MPDIIMITFYEDIILLSLCQSFIHKNKNEKKHDFCGKGASNYEARKNSNNKLITGTRILSLDHTPNL